MRMKQSGPRESDREKEQELQEQQLSMRPKQSNYSFASEVSFSTENKKPKSKSFNRREPNRLQDLNGMIKIYKDLQYSQEMRNLLKKSCYLEKDKFYKLSVTELKQSCQRQLKRFQSIKKNNVGLQRFLMQQDLEDTDNQLSLITISCQVRALVDAKKDLGASNVSNSESMTKVKLRQYQSILLEVEKSDQAIRNFIDAKFKLLQPKEINIEQCKAFFKRQVRLMSRSSSRLILSRKTLCEIIIFLCRLLEGQILAFDEVYQNQEQQLQTYEFGDENNKTIVYNKTTRNNQTIVQNLDQSFSQSESQKELKMYSYQSIKSLTQNQVGGQSRSRVYKDYSIDDLGKKVHQLAGICEQIPQLQAFTRTLKFSKITLDNRESFFKIVDVIIALHHKIGYLSRNKPTLLKEIETIESDLTQVYESIREFVASLSEDIPKFKQLEFHGQNGEDHKHQLTETLSYLRKDLQRLSTVLKQQNSLLQMLYKKIQLIRQIVQCFCQSIHDGDETQWRGFSHKLMAKHLDEDENLILTWLNQSYSNIIAELKSSRRNHEEYQTQKTLQAQVHTLLADYERLRGQHQQLQNKYSALVDQKDEHLFDIQERNKIITNLTTIKVAAQKRQKILKDQLIQSQNDAQRYEHDLGILQQQLEMLSIENQNRINDLLLEHQNEVKELVDKISNLQRAKMEILNKYETECSKSIRLLQDGSSSTSQIQALKERLERKTKQVDENQKKFKETLHLLEKQLQQLRSQKSLGQNKLQLAEKNKNKLIAKLQQLNSKHNKNTKQLQQKYEDEIKHLNQQMYKIEKELDKYKRGNDRLSEEVESLKAELNSQMRAGSDYRQKFIQLNPLQAQYQTLAKEYQRIMDNFHKSEINCDNYKQKCFDLTVKHEQLIQTHTKDKDLLKKAEKKHRQAQSKLQELLVTYDGLDADYKEQLKINKFQNKRIAELQNQIQALQDSLKDKDKTYSAIMGKSQTKYKLINEELAAEVDRLRTALKTVNSTLDEKDSQIRGQQKTISQLNNDLQLKQVDYDKLKAQCEKRLKQQSSQLQSLQQRNRSLQEQTYNQTIMLQQIKTQKLTLQSRLTQVEPKLIQYDQMKTKLQSVEQSESKLKFKISQLELQEKNLIDQNDKLKLSIRQHQNSIKNLQQQLRTALQQLKLVKQQLKRNQVQREEQQKQQVLRQQKQQVLRQQQLQINSITQLKQQILIEKTTIVNENNKLHTQNIILQEEVEKLKLLNQALEKNIKKLQQTLEQQKQQHLLLQNQLKQNISKQLFTINSLQNQLTTLNLQHQALTKDYQDLHSKVQSKNKLLAEKDHLLFEMELQKGNYEKLIKQYKLKNAQLQTQIENLNQNLEKLKSGKLKPLENQLSQLNDLLNEWKKKQELARINANDFQSQIDKLKRDYNKKLQGLKEEKAELEEYYQNQIKKLLSQHQLELSAIENKTRKDAENSFNQLLIKQKENLNNLTISKMQQLGQMQKKYERLIRQQRTQKNFLQEDYNNLEREFNEYKRSKSQAHLKVLVNQQDNQLIQQLQKFKLEFQTLKRDNTRLAQENNRLASENSSLRQQNGGLSTKLIDSQHMTAILQSKLNLLTQTVQNMRHSLQQTTKSELQKLNLQRENEKLRNTIKGNQSRLGDYKTTIDEMEQKIAQLEGKMKEYRMREVDWERNTANDIQRVRLLTTQGEGMATKLNEMKQKLSQMTGKLSQNTTKLQSTESQLKASTRRYRQKQLQMEQIRQQLSHQISVLEDMLKKKTNAMKEMEELLREWEERFNEGMRDWQSRQLQIKKQIKNKDNRIIQLQHALQRHQTDTTNENQQLIKQISKLTNKNISLQNTINQMSRSVEDYEGKLCQLNKKLINVNNEILGLRKANDQLRLKGKQDQEVIGQKEQVIRENQQIISQLGERIKSLQLENEQLQQKLNHSSQNISITNQSHNNALSELKRQHDNDKQQLLSKHQHTINSLQDNLSKYEQKLIETNDKYKLLLEESDELNNMIEKLKRENMQLSSHSSTYEEKIQIYEINEKQLNKHCFEIESKYLAAENDKATLQQRLDRLEKQLQKYKNQQISNSNKKKSELQILNQGLQTQNNTFKSQLTHSENQIERLNRVNAQLKQQIVLLKSQIQRLNEVSGDFKGKLQIAKRQNQTLLSDNKSLYQHLENTQRESDQLRRENSLLHQKLSTSQQQISRLTTINTQLTTVNIQLAQNLQTTKHQLHLANDSNSNMQQNLLLIKQQRDKLQQSVYSYQHSVTGSSQEIGKLVSQLNNLKGIIQQQVGKIRQLEEERNKLNGVVVKCGKDNKMLTDQIDRLNHQIDSLNGQNQHLNKQNIKLQQTINSIGQQNEQLRNENIKLQQTINSIGQQNEHLRGGTLDYQKQTTQLRQQNANLHNANSNLQQLISSLSQQITQLKTINSNLQQRLNSSADEISSLYKTIEDLKKHLSQTEGLLNWQRNQTALLRRNLQLAEEHIHTMEAELKFNQDHVFGLQEDRKRMQLDMQSLSWQLETYKNKTIELQSVVERMQTQQKQNQTDKKAQQTYQIERLRTELALTRQELLRVNELIKRKDQDFNLSIKRINNEKAQMWKDNQALAQEYQLLKGKFEQLQGYIQSVNQQYEFLRDKFSQLQISYQQKNNDFEIQRQQKQKAIQQTQRLKALSQKLKGQVDRFQTQSQKFRTQAQRFKAQGQRSKGQTQKLRGQISQMVRQLKLIGEQFDQSRLRQQQLKKKQQQLTRTLISKQAQIRKATMQIESYKVRISTVANERLDSEKKLKEQIAQLQRENARLQGQLSLTRLEYERLSGENSKLSGQSLTVSQLSKSLKEENTKLKEQIGGLTLELNTSRQQNAKLLPQMNALNNQFNKCKQQLSKTHQQLVRIDKQLSMYKRDVDWRSQQAYKQKMQIQRLQQDLFNRRQAQEMLRRTVVSLTEQNQKMKEQLDQAGKEIVQMRGKIVGLENQINSLKKQLIDKDKLIKEMGDSVDKGKTLLASADNELKLALQDKIKLNKIITQLNKQKQTLISTIKTSQTDNTSLRNTITILQQKITTLQTEIRTYQSNLEQQLGNSRSSINLVTKSYSYQGGQFAELNRLEEEIKRLIKEIQHKEDTIKKNVTQIEKLHKEIKILKEQIHLLSEGKTINIKGYTRVTNPHDSSLNTKGVVYTQYDVKEMKTKIEILQKTVSRYQDRQTELLREIQKYKFRERAHNEQIRLLSDKLRKYSINNGQELSELMTLSSSVKKTSFDDHYNTNRQNQPQSSTYRLQTGIEFTQRTINMAKRMSEKGFMRVESEELRKTIERISCSQQLMDSKIDEILDQSRRISRECLQQVLMNTHLNLTANIVSEIRDLIHQNKALIETMRTLKEYREDVTLLIQQYIDPELLTEFVYRILTYFSQVQEESPEANEIRQQLNAIRRNNVGGYYFTVLQQYTKYILQNNSIEIYKQQLRQKARQLIAFRQKFQSLIDSKLQENNRLLNRSDSKSSMINKGSRSKYVSSRAGSEASREGSRVKQYTTSRTIVNSQQRQYLTIPYSSNEQPVSATNITASKPNPVQITVNQPEIKTVSSRITYAPFIKQPTVTTATVQNQSPVRDVRTQVVYSTTTSSNYLWNGFPTVASSSSNIIRTNYEKK